MIVTVPMALVWQKLLMSFAVLVILRIPATCLAQQSTSSLGDGISGTQEPTVVTTLPKSISSPAPVQTHTIQVGLADHKIRPETTKANIGDVSVEDALQTP